MSFKDRYDKIKRKRKRLLSLIANLQIVILKIEQNVKYMLRRETPLLVT